MIGKIPACITCEHYKVLDVSPWGTCTKCSDEVVDENFHVFKENADELTCGFYKFNPKYENKTIETA